MGCIGQPSIRKVLFFFSFMKVSFLSFFFRVRLSVRLSVRVRVRFMVRFS